MEQAKKAVVIYHDNCVDGFASAWAFHKLKEKDYPEGVQYIPCQYGQNPFNYSTVFGPADLYILDFSFHRETISAIHKGFKHILILDHHKTAQDTLQWPENPIAGEGKPDNVEIVFDMERSGCGITWDYFAFSEERFDTAYRKVYMQRPALINYVEDRDIWRFVLPESRYINAAIGAVEKNFDAYTYFSKTLEAHFSDVAEIGEYLTRQLANIHKSIIKNCKRKITINGQVGLVCNCNGMFSSEIGNILAKESGTFGATYYHDSKDSVKFSLRSIGDYDVSEIAKIFGGGGHKNAAGFELKDPTPEMEDGVIIWSPAIESKGIAYTPTPELGEPNAG